jgi:hypothetical protein
MALFLFLGMFFILEPNRKVTWNLLQTTLELKIGLILKFFIKNVTQTSPINIFGIGTESELLTNNS